MTISRNHKQFLWITTATLALLSAISPFAVDGMNPAIPTIAEYLGVKINMVEMLITSYLLGLTIGQFFGGPLSDSFGRKPIALIGIALYAITSALIPSANSIQLILVLRVIQAIGGGFSVVINMAMIRDLFRDKDIAQAISLVGTIAMLAPICAPVFGTIMLTIWGWKAIFYGLTVLSLVVGAAFMLILPESMEKSAITRKVTVSQFVNSYKLFFANRRAVLIMLSIAFSAGGLFTYITVSPTLFMKFFGFSEIEYTEIFLSLLIGNIILNIVNIKVVKRYGAERMAKIGMTLFVLSGLALFAGTLIPSTPFIGIYIPLIGYISALALLYSNMVSLIMEMFSHIAGTANAVIGVIRFLAGALFGTATSLLYNGTLIPFGVAIAITSIGSATMLYYGLKLPSKYTTSLQE